MRVGGRLEDHRVGAGAGCEPAHVVAPERAGTSQGGGQQRLLGRHAHVAHRQGDAERHRGRVARAGVAVGGDGHVHAGVDRAAGVGVRLARGEVRCGQEGGDGVARGQRGHVLVREVGAVVHRRRAHLDRELHPRPEAELIAVHAQAEARRAARLEHGARLVGVEGALLAEHVDPARERAAGVEHLAAHQLHVLVRAPLVLGRDGVGSEEGHVVGQLGGDGARAALGLRLEPVPGLDLEVGDPRLDRLSAPARVQVSEARPRSRRGWPRW